jgi:hypothetical protein
LNLIDAFRRTIQRASFVINIIRIGLALIEENASATNPKPTAIRFEGFAYKDPESLNRLKRI